MNWLGAVTFGDSIEARIVAILGAVVGVFIVFRLILRYEKVFIADQDREIRELRGELRAAQQAIAEARIETEACHRERTRARLEIDELRREIAQLRRQIET